MYTPSQVPTLAAAPDAVLAASAPAGVASAEEQPARRVPGDAPRPMRAPGRDDDSGDEEPEPPPASFYGRPYLAPDRGGDAPPPPHFIAECFFVTGQLMHTGTIPAGMQTDVLERGGGGGTTHL